MRVMNLLMSPKHRRLTTTESRHGTRRFPNLVRGVKASRPDQIWVAYITYIRLRSDEIYRAILMDQYTRSVRGYHVSWSSGPGFNAAATPASFTTIRGAGIPSLRPRDTVRSKSLCQANAGCWADYFLNFSSLRLQLPKRLSLWRLVPVRMFHCLLSLSRWKFDKTDYTRYNGDNIYSSLHKYPQVV